MQSFIPPYHAQANLVERVDRTLRAMINSFLKGDHRDWDLHLVELGFALNTAVYSSLVVSPSFMNLGRNPTPSNLLRNYLEDREQKSRRRPGEEEDRARSAQSRRASGHMQLACITASSTLTPAKMQQIATLPSHQPGSSCRGCWNCGVFGHSWVDCQRPSLRFCRMCGRHNCTIATGPSCCDDWSRRRLQELEEESLRLEELPPN